MYTLFQLTPHQVHFSDNSLNTHKLVSHLASHSPWSDEIGSQISLKANFEVVYFGFIFPLLFSKIVLF